MAEVVFDVLEQILIRLDGIDLLRCKRVCKSWLSCISSKPFVKAHLNYTLTKDYKSRIVMLGGRSFLDNGCHIVGSSNGLVCLSPNDFQLLVTNPLTREVNYLPAPPLPEGTPPYPCWGFGYDPSVDDYKVIPTAKHRTRFHLLQLKSNIWKLIGDIKYECAFRSATTRGVLCQGSLHWFMNDRKNNQVIVSFDLSLEEFKTIPKPDDLSYEYDMLGFTEKSLCIYKYETQIFRIKRSRDHVKPPPRPRIWMMKSYQSWEQVPYPFEAIDVDPLHITNLAYTGSLRVTNYMSTPIFVETLVSPHHNPINTTNDNKRKIKATDDNKALTRKRKRKRKIHMLVIDPKLRADYQCKLKFTTNADCQYKLKLTTNEEQLNYQNPFDIPCKKPRESDLLYFLTG